VPRSTVYTKARWMKRKYYEKVLSESAIELTFIRALDVERYFGEQAWFTLPVFDLAELGLSILYAILPIEYQPLTIDFEYVTPTPEEALQGVWAKFEPVRFERLYVWLTDFKTYVVENFKVEYQPEVILGTLRKAKYGETYWGRGIYDPQVQRDFLRATFQRLRLMRLPDRHYANMLEGLVEYLKMAGVTDEHVFNRLITIFSAQTNSFVLGLSMLGRSHLTETEGRYAKIPVIDAKGVRHIVKFRTLDHLMLGMILGLTPLGYGLLLPKESIFTMPEGKRNPPIIKLATDKTTRIVRRIPLLAWGYSNYNRAEEMRDFYKSERADQWSLLQEQRRHVERWVYERIPPEESNSVRIRQYQNAVLQLVYWRAKRHKWGFQGFEAMDEDQFKGWWKGYWKGQGLKESTLESLYEGMKLWLQRLRSERLRLGERVKRRRLQLARAL